MENARDDLAARAVHYRAEAAKAEKSAADAPSEDLRAAFLCVAEGWSSLALSLEQNRSTPQAAAPPSDSAQKNSQP